MDELVVKKAAAERLRQALISQYESCRTLLARLQFVAKLSRDLHGSAMKTGYQAEDLGKAFAELADSLKGGTDDQTCHGGSD